MIIRRGLVAKNTAVLWCRLLITIAISLYTSRIVLKELGFADFGLYALIGSVVAFFSFINVTLTSSTQRFLNFEMGRQDGAMTQKVFASSRTVLACTSIIAPAIAFATGFLMIDHFLNIPIERVNAARYTLVTSSLALGIGTLNIPYTSVLIAHERMDLVALLGITDVVLRLGAAIALQFSGGDKLVLYASLLALAPIPNLVFSLSYTRKRFPECRAKWTYDPEITRSLLTFSSWSSISMFSVMLRNHGSAVLINLFHGPAGNAAYAIGMQVYNVAGNFVRQFSLSAAPQIVKSYAAGDLNQMRSIIDLSSRIALFLALLFTVPIYLEAQSLVSIWLGSTPKGTIEIVQFVLVLVVAESVAQIQASAQGATGRIRAYHVVLGSTGLLSLPFIYLLFTQGHRPQSALLVGIVVAGFICLLRLFFLRTSISLRTIAYIHSVYGRMFLVLALAVPAPLLLQAKLGPRLSSTLLVLAFSAALLIIIGFFVAIDRDERRSLISAIMKKLNRQP